LVVHHLCCPISCRGKTLLEQQTFRIDQFRLQLRVTYYGLVGMMIVQFFFWLFLPKFLCGSHVSESNMCLGGADSFIDPSTASLIASLTGFIFGWTVIPGCFMVIDKLSIRIGEDYKELNKAVRDDPDSPRSS
jgi:hypothetical protein